MGIMDFNTDKPDSPDYMGERKEVRHEAAISINRPMTTHARFESDEEAVEHFKERAEKMQKRFENSTNRDTNVATVELLAVWRAVEKDGEEIRDLIYEV